MHFELDGVFKRRAKEQESKKRVWVGLSMEKHRLSIFIFSLARYDVSAGAWFCAPPR